MPPTKKSLTQRKREHAARRLLSQPEDHAVGKSRKTRGGVPQTPPRSRGLALRHAALSQSRMVASMASSVAVESPVLAQAGLCTR